jgi:hypothetical protein
MPGWKSAEFKFVQAGETLDNLPPDNNPEIIHVDTGFGKFDHHQTDKETCASKLVFEYLELKLSYWKFAAMILQVLKR